MPRETSWKEITKECEKDRIGKEKLKYIFRKKTEEERRGKKNVTCKKGGNMKRWCWKGMRERAWKESIKEKCKQTSFSKELEGKGDKK